MVAAIRNPAVGLLTRQTVVAMADAPFWSDDFDMDLPKVIPAARDALGDVAELSLVTHGHVTHGRLNHPSVWNHSLGSVAFFGRSSPMKPASYWTDDPLVPCTLWEAIRDVWSHDFVLLLEHNPVWNHPEMYNQHFYPLMSNLRGWSSLPAADIAEHKACVLDAIRQTAMLVRHHISPDRDAQSEEERHG
jgi:hypothetical protein